ncbi:hypothetical protein BKA62DRAFT_588854, partial [Auriculariales sp. MPI-PUGE-AT-0066]
RPDLPHRNSSTKHIPEAEHQQQHVASKQHIAISSLSTATNSVDSIRSRTVARASHRGVAAAESKPYNPDAEHAGSRETHDGSVPEKVNADGPPQPDWDKANKERDERREAQKKAEEGGSGDKDYPEQIHAGKIGVGPSIADRNHATFGEKVAGLKQVIVGKVTRKPETVEHGRDMMSGAAKRDAQQNEDQELAKKFDKPDNAPGAAPAQ